MGNFIPFVLLWMKFLVDNFGQIKQLRRLQLLIFCLCWFLLSPMIGFPVKMFLSDCFNMPVVQNDFSDAWDVITVSGYECDALFGGFSFPF